MKRTASTLIKSWLEESKSSMMEYSYSPESDDGYRAASSIKVGMKGGYDGNRKALGFIQRARSLNSEIPSQNIMEPDREYISRVCEWCDENQREYVDLEDPDNERKALRLCDSFETYDMPAESQTLIWYLRGYSNQWIS